MSKNSFMDQLAEIKNDFNQEFKKMDSLLETQKNHKPLSWKFEQEYSLKDQSSSLKENFFGFVREKLSAIIHRHRMKKYSELSRQPKVFRILAEGDSWFLHPLVDDIVENLLEAGYAVCCYSEAGDTLVHMAGGLEFINALKYERPMCFILSGGGNDILDREVLISMLDSTVPGFINQERLEAKMRELEASIEKIIGIIQGEKPGLKLFMHGYDYIIPREHEFMWVYPVMLSKNIVSPQDQRFIIKKMIDRFNNSLIQIQQKYKGLFYHIDLRGMLRDEAEWADEIHPSPEAFKRITGILIQKIEQEVKNQ